MTQETTPLDETTVVPEAQPEKSATNATGKTFTEAEVQELIKDRLARQAGSERKKAFEELGIEDPLTDKELLAAARAKREADKTEVERLAGETAKEKERREKLEQEYADFKASVEAEKRSATRNRAILAAAATEHAFTPEDVIPWAEANAPDALAKTLKDDGTADGTAVTALVKKCREARPKWFGTGGPGSPGFQGGRAADPGNKDRQNAAFATAKALRDRL